MEDVRGPEELPNINALRFFLSVGLRVERDRAIVVGDGFSVSAHSSQAAACLSQYS